MQRVNTSNIDNPLTNLGTLNLEALKLPVLNSKKNNSSFDLYSELTLKAEYLKKKNKSLNEKLNNMIFSSNPTPFCLFKQWEIKLKKRMKQRDLELEEFSKFLIDFRTKNDSSFVEIESSNNKNYNYDPIVNTLLVNNKHLNFFNKKDIENKNKELLELI